MTERRLRLGRLGEAAAARWYRSQGYRIEASNWRHGRGELDLICSRGTTVAFVEVKTRSTAAYGGGLAAVDGRKQKQIRKLARAWLDESDRWYEEIRFDVVDVDSRGHLQVVEAAF